MLDFDLDRVVVLGDEEVCSVGVVLLARHGQASFGTADYDRLSPLGLRQGLALGQFLRASSLDPSRVVAGSMRRQLDTASAACRQAGWSGEIEVDPGWDEYDHGALVAAGHPGVPPTPDPVLFQGRLDASLSRWAGGWTPPGAETFDEFTTRVQGRLQEVSRLQSGVTVVFTSAGVIAWLCSVLVGGGVPQWVHLNRVVVNASLSKVVSGKRGLTMVTFNEHNHLPQDARSYR